MNDFLENAPWWSAKDRDEEPHKRIIPLVRQLKQRQETRYTAMRRYATIYEYGYNAVDRVTAKAKWIDDGKLFFNFAQNVVDTIVAQIATPRVQPMALTEGASYGARQKAKELTQCIEGQWDECDLDSVKEQIITDACIFEGVGLVKGYASQNCDAVVFKRVCPLDVFVDDAEAIDGEPRCFYHRQRMDRYVAAEDYGQPDPSLNGSAKTRRQKILKAPAARIDDDADSSLDRIELWESWHLPSRMPDPSDPEDKGSQDGRHCIVIDGCTLLDEPWEESRFPFAVFKPKKARQGWWGIPAMRQLAAGQREYEKVTAKLQRAHQKMGGSHFIVNRNAKIAKRTMTNDSGDVWEVDGDPANVRDIQPTPANPQTYQYRDGIVADMLRSTGNSTFSAQGAVPAGLQQASGKALEVFSDENSKYHILWHREVERWTLDVTDLMKMVVRQILKVKPDFSSKYREKRGYKTIAWKDLIDEDHVVRVFPVSMLAQAPAAKFAQLSELLNAGAITVEQFRRLFELPDIESETDIDAADTDIIDRNLDHMVMTGRYLAPQPFDDLQLLITRAGKFYNACRVQDVPDARLELIRNCISDAQALMNPPAPAGAAPPMAPPVGPPGMPPPGAAMPPPAPPGAPMMPPGAPPPPGMAA